MSVGQRLLTIAQLAERLGVHVNTVRNWANRGLIPHIKLPSGYRRFKPEEVERFAQEMGLGETGAKEGGTT